MLMLIGIQTEKQKSCWDKGPTAGHDRQINDVVDGAGFSL